MLKRLFSGLLLITMAPVIWAGTMTDHDPLSLILFWMMIIFTLAITGRLLALKLHQPGVLGELLMGVLLGNIGYFFHQDIITLLREGGVIFMVVRDVLQNQPLAQAVYQNIPHPAYAAQALNILNKPESVEYIKLTYVLDAFSRYGVIFLLFMAGLESSVKELKQTGIEALRVAIIGVVAPFALGFFAIYTLNSKAGINVNLFIAAALSATSIGITARVLGEMKKLKTREARTILGAAMLDDVLGLIILAIVSSLVTTGKFDCLNIFTVIVATSAFFIGAITLGPLLLRSLISWCRGLERKEAKLFIAFLFMTGLAWLASTIGLASIIGAFAAGMIINDDFFDASEKINHPKSGSLKDLLAPFEAVFAPLFFMLIGIQVKLETFMNKEVLITAGVLILAAIIGKLLSGLGGAAKDDKWLIGIGMLPRGEVGLVFASIGQTLGIISPQVFAALILMVIVTTVLAPPLLKMRYAKV